MVSAEDALRRLQEGNSRFAANVPGARRECQILRRWELLGGQKPFAVVIGCSDSRVPVEIVFDQGLGDLFVVRVAGNVVASSQVGSVEFAAEEFGTRLVVVLGHSDCGAIRATVKQLRQDTSLRSPNLRSIVSRIRPAVEEFLDPDLPMPDDVLMHHAIRANVRAAADHLRHGSATLEHLVEHEGLRIVGAEYCLETGLVEFFDGP